MLTLLRSFDLAAYQPRCYVVASTDKLSAQKAAAFEAEHAAASGPRPSNAQPGGAPTPSYSIAVIPRSREVGQSFTSSVWTTLLALWHSMRPVAAFRPDLVLVNGPGTALPMVLATWCLRALGLSAGKVVYSESIARVRHMSLTGKILYHLRLTDEFMVQWEELREAYPRCAYAGRLM